VASSAIHRWSVRLPAEFGHADITPELEAMVRESGIQTGVLTVQLVGSTGAITDAGYGLWAVGCSESHGSSLESEETYWSTP
jgi:hypothetical protein